MKNKKTIIIVIIIAIIILMSGILLLVFGNETPTNKKMPEAKESIKKLIDGDVSNVEETLNEQHIYKNYRIKSLRVAALGPDYGVIFIIDNISDQTLEHEHLSLTFLDSNKQYISEINVEIPELLPGSSTTIRHYAVGEEIYNKAFDYKISKAKEVTLPDKN